MNGFCVCLPIVLAGWQQYTYDKAAHSRERKGYHSILASDRVYRTENVYLLGNC
jgi:hypothetical protein